MVVFTITELFIIMLVVNTNGIDFSDDDDNYDNTKIYYLDNIDDSDVYKYINITGNGNNTSNITIRMYF